ncbi:MAG TPA: hypothetical protein VL069_11530, partial [Opitutus sp.]|nr:hypothetical protein [Opitutus sp.]
MANPFSASPRREPDESSVADRETSSPLVQQAAQGWTGTLTFCVTLGFVIEIVTGLWVLFAPFSLASQLVVLVHGVS